MASKRRLRRKACDGKQRFVTQDDAVKAIRALRRKKGVTDWLTAYRCKFCGGGFHFGHPPKKVRDAINASRANKC